MLVRARIVECRCGADWGNGIACGCAGQPALLCGKPPEPGTDNVALRIIAMQPDAVIVVRRTRRIVRIRRTVSAWLRRLRTRIPVPQLV